MDISSLGGLTGALTQMQSGDPVGTLVLKKAQDIQAQNVMQLLQGVPPVASNPPNLGNSVDIKV